jgi:hypothetical protein
LRLRVRDERAVRRLHSDQEDAGAVAEVGLDREHLTVRRIGRIHRVIGGGGHRPRIRAVRLCDPHLR